MSKPSPNTMNATPSSTPTAQFSFTTPNSHPFSLQNVVLYTGCILAVRLGFSFLRRILRPSSTSAPSTTTTTDRMSSEPETRQMSRAELSAACGGEGQSLYIAMKDPYSDKTNVFDVSSGHDFYGPGSGYHLFAGRDATYGLATSCLDKAKLDGDLSSLTQSEKDTHVQWYEKYASKYPIVGHLVDDRDAGGTNNSDAASKKDD